MPDTKSTEAQAVYERIEELNGNTTERCGRIPAGYKFYLWNNDKGYENLGTWVEAAARAAGR